MRGLAAVFLLMAAAALPAQSPVVARAAPVSDNPHGQLSVPCSTCHLAEAWKPARVTEAFRHAPETFLLEGAHARTSCTTCHERLDFKGVSPTCASCHEDVHKGELGADCARCHTPRSFAEEPAMKQAHELTRFPLRGAHAAASCTACHAPAGSGQMQFVNRGTNCATCHAADARAVQYPDHQAAGFTGDCTSCHSINTWKNPRFDHAQTAFPLVGAHQAASCVGCHADRVYRGKDTQCVSCHRTDYDQTTAPRHVDGFPSTCADCHGNVEWKGARFDHQLTRFPLEGAHAATTCQGCHGDGMYRGKPTDCASCHQADFNATTNPPHGAAGFTAPCTSCHTTSGWAGGGFDHDATRFPLTGGHRATTCAGCHADRVFRGKPTTCLSCHQADYDRTTTPPHRSGFPTNCESCHGTNAWNGATFDHGRTDFALTGAHLAVTCASCHGDGVFNGKPTDCASCHLANFQATTNPPHAAAGYSTACVSCHSTSAWLGAPFDHATTQFPLTGAHVAVKCQLCHGDGVYNGKPTECLSCHQTEYQATTRPPHGSSGIGTTCTSCHSTQAWPGATYDHNVTAFPLTGAHRAASCDGCHGDRVYRGKPSTCVSCHQSDFDNATAPAHAGFPTSCESCHGTADWTGGSFDHAQTDFPLTGAHRATVCASCHADGVYNGKPTDCANCHLASYQATTNPPHAAAGYTTACVGCHNTTAWLGAPFDHSTTQFPLTGAHLAVSCQLCHGDGVYDGKPTACLNCHQADYTATARPPHGSSGIGTTCTSCHTTAAWLPGAYDHSVTTFPLTGAHTAATCAGCHGDGVYRGKPSTCVSCHQTDYNQSTNPNHAAAGFPTTCSSCHSTATWSGATFDHDGQYFPIYSGNHRGQWSSCATCHTSPTNYQVFTCLTCHLQSKMDDEHRGRSGYSYTSQACYSCHPRGKS